MTDYTIEKAREESAEQIARNELYVDAPWTEAQVRAEIADGSVLFLAALKGGEVIGHVSARFFADECEVANIVVVPGERRRGVGRALLSALIDGARSRGAAKMFLYVRDGNVPAAALYGGLGFERVGTRKGYYHGTDGIIMQLEL